jgi:hypothetical protein
MPKESVAYDVPTSAEAVVARAWFLGQIAATAMRCGQALDAGDHTGAATELVELWGSARRIRRSQ